MIIDSDVITYERLNHMLAKGAHGALSIQAETFEGAWALNLWIQIRMI